MALINKPQAFEQRDITVLKENTFIVDEKFINIAVEMFGEQTLHDLKMRLTSIIKDSNHIDILVREIDNELYISKVMQVLIIKP